MECRIELSSVFEDLVKIRFSADSAGGGGSEEEEKKKEEEERRESGKGWKFVRLLAKKNELTLGWGVYEMWIE